MTKNNFIEDTIMDSVLFAQSRVNDYYISLTKYRKDRTKFEEAFERPNQLAAFGPVQTKEYKFTSECKSLSAQQLFESMEDILTEIEAKEVVNGIVVFKKPMYPPGIAKGYNYFQCFLVHPSTGIPFSLLLKEIEPHKNVITLTLEFVIIYNE